MTDLLLAAQGRIGGQDFGLKDRLDFFQVAPWARSNPFLGMGCAGPTANDLILRLWWQGRRGFGRYGRHAEAPVPSR